EHRGDVVLLLPGGIDIPNLANVPEELDGGLDAGREPVAEPCAVVELQRPPLARDRRELEARIEIDGEALDVARKDRPEFQFQLRLLSVRDLDFEVPAEIDWKTALVEECAPEAEPAARVLRPLGIRPLEVEVGGRVDLVGDAVVVLDALAEEPLAPDLLAAQFLFRGLPAIRNVVGAGLDLVEPLALRGRGIDVQFEEVEGGGRRARQDQDREGEWQQQWLHRNVLRGVRELVAGAPLRRVADGVPQGPPVAASTASRGDRARRPAPRAARGGNDTRPGRRGAPRPRCHRGGASSGSRPERPAETGSGAGWVGGGRGGAPPPRRGAAGRPSRGRRSGA